MQRKDGRELEYVTCWSYRFTELDLVRKKELNRDLGLKVLACHSFSRRLREMHLHWIVLVLHISAGLQPCPRPDHIGTRISLGLNWLTASAGQVRTLCVLLNPCLWNAGSTVSSHCYFKVDVNNDSCEREGIISLAWAAKNTLDFNLELFLILEIIVLNLT